jgi:hypothetical protein
MAPSKLQPALLGGVAIGVLSALPLVNLGNACCCAWVILGGGLAAYLMQQNQPGPVSAGDGALVGLGAGVIGAVLASVLSIPVSMAMGPLQADVVQRILERSSDFPPEVRSMLEQMRGGMFGTAVIGIGFIIGMLFSMCVYAVFGLFGGLLGAVVFKKDAPPPPPPSGFGPPPFTTPPFTTPTNFPPPPPPSVS